MIRAALSVVLLLASTSARADDEDLLGIQIRSKVQVGQKPAIVLQPQMPVKSVSAVLTADGKRVSLRSGPIGLGGRKELGWSQEVGTRAWEAVFKATFGDGHSGTFTITFETTVFPKIASTLTKEDVDLGARSLTVRLNQPASKVELKVTGEDGKPMYEGETTFDEAAAGTPLTASWEQPDGAAVLRIAVKVWSAFGFWIGTEVTPFEVEIPHEDVVFEFGRADVTASEAPKIDRTLELLAEKVKRYGGFIKLQLYIAGYTDTVGPRSSNRELSEARARSIAGYFRRKGVSIPIYFQGFGEDVLAVQTPDETKEARNRRAVYVLSASPPAIQASIPRAAWRPL